MLADQRGVPRRAARHDEDAVGVEEALLVVEYARQHDVLAVGAHAAADAVAQRAGLLEDLFEHEVGIAPLFQFRDAHPEFLDVDLRLLVVHVEDVERLAPVDDGDLVVVEIDHAVRVFDDRRCIRRDEILAVAYADHQRAALARHDDLVGIAAVDHRDGISADDLVARLAHRFEEHAARVGTDVVDQLDDHLRIGLAAERVAVLFERLLDHRIVLDRPVVYDGQIARLRSVGMGVRVVGFAVRRPARVSDADRAAAVFRLGEMFQRRDLSFGLTVVEFSFVRNHGYARRVVTPIFQPVKSFDQYGISLLAPDISDDTAHKLSSVFSESDDCVSGRTECRANRTSAAKIRISEGNVKFI